MEDRAQQPSQLPTQEQFQTLVKDANKGNPEALAALRQLLHQEPQISQHFGDLFEAAKMALIGLIGANNVLLVESLRREAMEKDLAGGKPTLLERLVVRRIVLNWLQLQHVDATGPEPSGKALKRKQAAERNWSQALR